MSQALAIVLVLACFAVGDVVSWKTGAKISSVFVTLMLFLILFMTGVFPADIMSTSGLQAARAMAGNVLIFHMGTNINIAQLKKEYKTLILAVLSMAIALVSIFALVPIIGLQNALVAVPIVNGGLVATDIMVGGAMEKGYAMVAVMGTLAFAVQKFVGTIPASRFGLKEAHKVVDELRAKKAADPNYSWYEEQNKERAANNAGKKEPLYKRFDGVWSIYTTLFVAYVANFIANNLAKLTNGWVAASIWCLVLGVLAAEIGIVPPHVLDRGRSSGFFTTVAYVAVIGSLGTVSFAQLGDVALTLVLIFAAVLLGTFLFLYILPGWKIVGSKELAVGIAMAQLLGYPATYLITQEIAKAVGETEEERDAISARIEPAYVIAGFATVTSLSVIIAGILVNML